ncbi:DUF3313 family protein [Wenzhouxiangella limi]|uniref:DUF3313 domain-containing protein n=1 Tax=Wenzhouxiangella limi TaxID=2707351 RepID=A0A845UVZ1_9GAMM|nr:DUF3313 family protein [Wenzhouxiangella limi]NDY94412.1 DUF3313 domain-containing protein [Wenzhouxiangella limi]
MSATLRLALLTAAALIVAGCATTPQSDYSHDGLELREVRGLDEVWVRPGTDFASYENLFVEPVEVAFDPHWDPRRTGSRLRLSDDKREEIRRDAAELFDRTFRRELEGSERFELVDEAGENTLVFEPKIIDLVINAPEDRMSSSRVRTYVSEFGRVTLVGELKDAASGAIVARISDKEIARTARPLEFTDRFINEREGERVIRQWARTLVEQLDGL